MILGIGNDIVDIRRIEKSCVRFGKRFEEKIFTEAEITRAEIRGRSGTKARAASLAKRFAAKEACAKALGTGIGKIKWQEIQVSNLPGGMPYLMLSGEAEEHLKKRIPPGMTVQMHLSLTDEYPIAQAFVVISLLKCEGL